MARSPVVVSLTDNQQMEVAIALEQLDALLSLLKQEIGDSKSNVKESTLVGCAMERLPVIRRLIGLAYETEVAHG